MKTDRLIQDYRNSGNALGEALQIEEIESLASSLRHRLNVSEKVLDLSPASLRRLEKCLQEHIRGRQEANLLFSDDEVVQVVREIAAYFGQVLMKNAGATWRGGVSLWDTSVQVEGPIKVVEGHKSHYSNKLVYLLGAEAATAWDWATQGAETQLYSAYLAMRRRVVKQQLR